MSKRLNDVSDLREMYFNKTFKAESNLAIEISRVSSKKQKEKTSLYTQEEGGVGYAKEAGLIIEETISLVETAYEHEDRKEFLQIIEKVLRSHKTNKKIAHLIFSHASRASRNKKSTQVLRELVLTYHFTLHYYREELILNEASSQSVWDRWERLHSNSEEENNERRKNSLGGMLYKYELGIPQQHAPFGYINIMLACGTKGYSFEPPYSSYIERAFHLAASGNPDFKTELDKEFLGIIDKKKLPSSRRLNDLLKDPFYYGCFRVKKTVLQGDVKYLPPLISKSLWFKVQRVFELRSRNTRSKNNNLAYTGTIKCGGDILDEHGVPTGEICGGSVSGEIKRGKSTTWGCGCTRKNCSHREASYMKRHNSQRYFSNEKIEQMMLDTIQGIKFSEEILNWFIKRIETTVFEQSDFNKSKMVNIQASITKKEQVLKKSFGAMASGIKGASSWKELNEELTNEIFELHTELKKLQEMMTEDDWLKEAVMEKISNLSQTFEEAPSYAKNKMILSFCNKLVLRFGKLTPDFKDFMKTCS